MVDILQTLLSDASLKYVPRGPIKKFIIKNMDDKRSCFEIHFPVI